MTKRVKAQGPSYANLMIVDSDLFYEDFYAQMEPHVRKVMEVFYGHATCVIGQWSEDEFQDMFDILGDIAPHWCRDTYNDYKRREKEVVSSMWEN